LHFQRQFGRLWKWSDSVGGDEVSNAFYSDPTITYSDIEGGYQGTGNIEDDPIFLPTIYNDPAGSDRIFWTADDHLALSYDSPCIDAGSNSAVPTGVTTDITGNDRIIDGDGEGEPPDVVDMGAYEYDPDGVLQAKDLIISGGEVHTLLLKPDRTVWACGSNLKLGGRSGYQLGVGEGVVKEIVIVPIHSGTQSETLPHLEDIIFIDAGWYHSLAVDKDNAALTWQFACF
jgi:hypothetical protein